MSRYFNANGDLIDDAPQLHYCEKSDEIEELIVKYVRDVKYSELPKEFRQSKKWINKSLAEKFAYMIEKFGVKDFCDFLSEESF